MNGRVVLEIFDCGPSAAKNINAVDLEENQMQLGNKEIEPEGHWERFSEDPER
jgi:hypothetical protein